MSHIILFVFLLLLVSGTASAVYLYHQYRQQRLPILKDLYLFILASLSRVMAFIVLYYIQLNIIRDMDTTPIHPLWSLRYIPSVLGTLGEFVMLWRVVLRLRKPAWIDSLSPWMVGLFLAGCAGLAVALTLRFTTGANQTLPLLQQATRFFILPTMLLAPAALIWPFQKKPATEAARTLGFMLLAGLYPMLLFPGILNGNATRLINLFMVWVHLVPMIWAMRSLKAAATADPSENITANLNRWVEEKRVTRRERELIDLIIAGQSNKEIEYELGIAFSTVKNHIYKIYKKLDVNSRAQLIHKLIHD